MMHFSIFVNNLCVTGPSTIYFAYETLINNQNIVKTLVSTPNQEDPVVILIDILFLKHVALDFKATYLG